MNILLSLFEGMCDLTLAAVIKLYDLDPEDFEEEPSA